MAESSTIEWTDATWNPITGCSVVSPGCTHCYAMRLAGTRLQHHPSRAGLTRDSKAGPVWTGEVRFNEKWLDQPLRWSKPRMIFVAAHGDLFHESVPDAWIDRVFAVMALAPQHTFQVLTKRAERMRAYCSAPDVAHRVAKEMAAINGRPVGAEEVRPIAGFPGYFVSSHGHVYSERRGERKKLRPDAGDQGHLRVPLFCADGTQRGHRKLLHRLVLEAFVGPAPSADAQGRHLDGNPSNNALGNLTWGAQSENWDDSKAHGTHRRYSKLSDADVAAIKARHAAGESAEAIARDSTVSATQIRNIVNGRQWSTEPPIAWPLANVWKGVSAEDQQRADERIPHLLATPAAVRWVSAEPLLGPIDLHGIRLHPAVQISALRTSKVGMPGMPWPTDLGRIDWVIAGGESGPNARPMHPDWARSLRDQCAAAGVPFYFKQHGEWIGVPDLRRLPGGQGPGFGRFDHCEYDRDHEAVRIGKARAGRLLDGVEHNGMPGVEA